MILQNATETAAAYPAVFPVVEMAPPPVAWYALRVRSNFEWAVNAALAGKEYEAFLPTYRTRRRWSDRTKEVEAPLFRGYTFCRFDATRRLPILTTPGVISIVGSTTGPIQVDECEIASVRAMVASRVVVGPWPFLAAGDYVNEAPAVSVDGTAHRLRFTAATLGGRRNRSRVGSSHIRSPCLTPHWPRIPFTPPYARAKWPVAWGSIAQ